MASIIQWSNAAKAWANKVPKLENRERVTSGEINHIQNQIANINGTILNDKMQYDSTVGGNIYDSSAAQAYYMAEKRGKYNKKLLSKAKSKYSKQLSNINNEISNAEYNEQYDERQAQNLRQQQEEENSSWLSVVMSVLGIIAMCFM